jgi:hypothetical protein
LPTSNKSRHGTLVTVLSFTVVAGMAIAALVLLLWTKYPASVADGAGLRAAVALCPPFMLVHVVGGTNDTTMGLIITAGTIVIANTSLYAGLAAFVYWAITTFKPSNPNR